MASSKKKRLHFYLLGVQNQVTRACKTFQVAFPNPTARRPPLNIKMDKRMGFQRREKEKRRRTFAMTIRSDKLFDTSFATPIGLVSQLLAFRSEPSGIVTVISSRG